MKQIKLFAVVLMAMISMSAWAQSPSLTLTSASSTIEDWNKQYDNITVSVQGAGYASKKTCGASSNANALSISSADSHWLEISCADGLNKVVIIGSGNSTGTTDWAAPLCVCTAAPFDSTITSIIEVHYTGYDKDCVENEIELPAGTKSVRLYRRMKVNSDKTMVGSGSNWTPASATGNQTYNISQVEVYAGSAAPSTDPVTAAVLSGPETGVEGANMTFSVAAAGATNFAWTLDGQPVSGATSSSFTYENAQLGDHTIYVTASNEYNNETHPAVQSNTINFSVTGICGEMVRANTNNATVTGLIGGTRKTNLSNGSTKKLDKNKYFGVALAGGATFSEGDIFRVHVTTASTNSGIFGIYADNAGDTLVYDGGANLESGWIEAELPAAANGKNALYLYRGDGNVEWNPSFDTVAVVRDCSTEPKLNVSMASVDLNVTAEITTATAKVAFSGKNLAAGTYALTTPNLVGLTVTPTSVIVAENGKLSAEVTLTYTSAVDVAAATAEMSLKIGDLTTSVTINYSASLAKKYLEKSVNIEQLVLDNSTSYDIKAVLDSANIEYANLNALDSLNDEKSARNEPYLGLKIKTSGGYMKALVKSGAVLRVKFGFIDKPLKLTLNGVDSTFTVEQAKAGFEFTATEDTYVTIATTSGNTVVFKQIMLNEAIKEVTLPEQVRFKVEFAETTNGKVTATEQGGEEGKAKFANKGTTVTLTITPDEGFEIETVKVNDNTIEAAEGVYSFTMPAADVVVAVTFKASGTETAVENIEVLDVNAPMYNVLGMKVDADYRGIVIQNGKKYIIR